MKITVINAGAKQLSVYPVSSEQTDGLGANVAVSIAPGRTFVFICRADGLWVTVRDHRPALRGSTASPTAVVAGTAIVPSVLEQREVFLIAGSGGVDVSANPQIAPGSFVGQELVLVGTSDSNTVLYEDSNGLYLNGAWIAENNRRLKLSWDGTVWAEESRQ